MSCRSGDLSHYRQRAGRRPCPETAISAARTARRTRLCRARRPPSRYGKSPLPAPSRKPGYPHRERKTARRQHERTAPVPCAPSPVPLPHQVIALSATGQPGMAAAGQIRRISTSRQHGIASFAARRDPGRLASASATPASAPVSGGVRRANGVVSPGICSENVDCPQHWLTHLNRRTWTMTSTLRPPSGRSASWRW